MSAPIDTHPFVVLVTGANRGLGFEYVRQLLNGRDSSVPMSAGFIDPSTGKSDVAPFVPSNAVIIATARDPASATELNKVAEASAGRLHVTKYEATCNDDVTALVKFIDEKFGRLDLAIMNAGITGVFIRPDLNEVDGADFTRTLSINAVAPIVLGSALLPVLRRTRDHKLAAANLKPLTPAVHDDYVKAAEAAAREIAAGARLRTTEEHEAIAASPVKIVFLSSIMGSMLSMTSPLGPAYCASKTSLNGFVRPFALTADGIAVAALHPGWVQTDMGNSIGAPPVIPKQSIAGMLDVIDRLDASKAPQGILDFQGGLLPF